MHIVFHRPVNRIARQSVSADQRDHAAVFQQAEATGRGGPQGAVWLELKAVHATRAESVCGCQRSLDATLVEIGETTVEKPQPQAAAGSIRRKRGGEIVMTKRVPRKLLDRMV